MQNKANVKIGKMNISAAIIKDYDKKQPRINDKRYSKQTQTNPILPAPKEVKQKSEPKTCKRRLCKCLTRD
jgi:hypothetical protein